MPCNASQWSNCYHPWIFLHLRFKFKAERKSISFTSHPIISYISINPPLVIQQISLLPHTCLTVGKEERRLGGLPPTSGCTWQCRYSCPKDYWHHSRLENWFQQLRSKSNSLQLGNSSVSSEPICISGSLKCLYTEHSSECLRCIAMGILSTLPQTESKHCCPSLNCKGGKSAAERVSP